MPKIYGPRKRKTVNENGIRDKYLLMVDEYFSNGFDKTKAARSQGYKHPSRYATVLFQKPEVVAEIERRRALLREKHELTEDWVIERLMAIADSGRVLAKYKKVAPDGTLTWDFTDAPEADLVAINELSVDFYTEGKGNDATQVKKFKVGTSDPKAALDSLCRKLGLFNDKVTVQGEVSLIERLQKGRERVKK